MPNKTTNYKLNKPLANENIDISVLNDNMDIIDAELAKKSEFSGSYDDLTNKPTIPDVSGKANTPTFSQYTILTSGWSSGVYSFESAFPSATYDIEIELDSTATEPQVEAWSSAKPTAVFGTNTMKALGDVPTVDIPVIVKKVTK